MKSHCTATDVHGGKLNATYWCNRSATLGVSQLPLLTVLGTKNNIIACEPVTYSLPPQCQTNPIDRAVLTGISYEKASPLLWRIHFLFSDQLPAELHAPYGRPRSDLSDLG